MSFFDDSHVTDVGLEGSAGPTVGFFDMVAQGYRQQFRVDSARALQTELQNRWLESLRTLDRNGGGRFNGPIDQDIYVAFAEHSQGQPITVDRLGVQGEGYGAKLVKADVTQNAYFQEMLRANEAIKKLNNPEIKSFEQILAEVSQMQAEVEGETASMSERGGVTGMIGELIGAVGGSFTHRDPLNVVTAPWGAGRTIATRIATEMGLAAAITGVTEITEVAPNRALVGLPERNPLFNIAAATLGAGVIRGGIEGIGVGVRRLRGEDIDFDLRDAQMQQMFDAAGTPTARAGAKAIDDMIFVERNNPYGDGQAAHARFMAELQQVQRVMGGEPMTAVARVLPPLPYDYIKKAGDFEIVKEQAPEVYARMEAAQARLAGIERQLEDIQGKIYFHGTNQNFDRFEVLEGWSRRGITLTEDRELADHYAVTRTEQFGLGEPRTIAASVDFKKPLYVDETNDYEQFIDEAIEGGYDAIIGPVHEGPNAPKNITVIDPDQIKIVQRPSGSELRRLRGPERRAAQREYQAAYRAAEVEAVRLREAQAAIEAAQQHESVGIFADATYGRPFNWSALQHDSVQARIDAINAFNDTLDEAAVARFVRLTEGEGEEAVEREAWRTDEGIDIGLKRPVDPEFRFDTDDGEMSIADAMRDLQDDADLDDAMRTCLL